ncbi:MAG: epoxyqueuosine reductase QueH [Eubacteriales bacterium]
MKLLFHSCCAPCSNAPLAQLKEQGISPTVFWYNPNIHPFQEYKQRKLALIDHCKAENIPLILEDSYGLRPFVKAVAEDIDHRCAHCYRIRLEKTAQVAKEEGFDSFTTSLFISPYQNHELMKEIAEEMAETYQLNFFYQDFRPLFREGQQFAREHEIYMQKYCGCIFSEEDRYLKKPQKK